MLSRWRSEDARHWPAPALEALAVFSSPVLLALLLALGQAQLEVLSAPRLGDSLLVICPLGWRPCDIVTHGFLHASCRMRDMRSDQALDLIALAAGVLAALVLSYLAWVLLS